MRLSFDWWWENVLKMRFPGLQLADSSYDQSHMDHALIVLLLFGPAGWLTTWLRDGVRSSKGLAVGLLAGLAFYFVREASWRVAALFWRTPEPMHWWDGALDVLVPLMVVGPFAAAALLGAVPGWLGVSFWSLGLLIASLYTVLRPEGAFLYGGKY